jgi:pimeloyl-ACP methyl ester carboxylesterase
MLRAQMLHRCMARVSAFLLGVCFLPGCTSYRTNPIVDGRGQPVTGSVAILERITLGGVPQWILIRGQSADNPILLKLHGGPGQAEMATVAMNRLLEEHFVVVEWDQRGAGKSASSSEPTNGMTLAQLVEDTHELTELLLERFHEKKLILVGHSWGSVLGLRTVQKYPDSYAAFVSTGQIASYAQGLVVGYRFLLDEARARGNVDALTELEQLGPPPYVGDDAKRKRAVYIQWLEEFGAVWHSSQKEFDRVGWMLSSVEYAWPEKLRFTGAAERSFDLLLPDLMAADLLVDVPRVDVPVYFAAGRYDRLAPLEVSRKYFDALIAPRKVWIEFEDSAHFPHWEQVEKFKDVLTKRVLPALEPRPAPSDDVFPRP